MQNSIKKFFERKVNIVCLLFIIGLIITIPSLIPSFNVDGYCTYAFGYLDSAKTFMKSGRLFTALIYVVSHGINLPFEIFSIISIVLANLFLALTIYKLFDHLTKYIDKSLLSKVMLLLGVFLIFYNPLTLELLLFEEAFIMCAGIYFAVLAALKFIDYNKKGYLLSALYLIISAICYQGIVCYFIPVAFLLVVINLGRDLKKEIPEIIKKGIIACIIYGISLIVSFVIVKFINSYIFTDGTQKLGTLDIIYNIKKAIELMFYSLKGLFGFGNRVIFYGFSILGTLFVSLSTIKNSKNHWTKVLYFICNLGLCVVMPFVPNLGMNSASNYTAARMIGSICSVAGFIVIYGIIYFNILKKENLKTIFIIMASLYSLYIGYEFLRTTSVGLKRYRNDMESIEKLHNKIAEYELENNIEVKNIYYATDSHVNYYYYQQQLTNSYNYRLYAIDWAMQCSINIGKDHNYKYTKMSDKDKERYFNNKEYDGFSDEQLVFVDDKLYLLIY